MDNISFDLLKFLFSESRINPYFQKHDSATEVLNKYHLNIVLSEAMLPALHYFEVCLRNRLNQLFCKKYGTDWLIKPPQELVISPEDIKKIDKISNRIRREAKRDPLHDDILAQMTFGFWCSFFHRKYDPILWHQKDSFITAFPNLSRINRKRSYIEHRILKIKDIRNRIAHHEPIWKKRSLLTSVHTHCIELIEAISQDAPRMLHQIDRFTEVDLNLSSVNLIFQDKD